MGSCLLPPDVEDARRLSDLLSPPSDLWMKVKLPLREPKNEDEVGGFASFAAQPKLALFSL